MNIFKKIYCRGYQLIFKVALPFLPYRLPKILSSQPEIVLELKKKNIYDVFIITDKQIVELGLLKELIENLKVNCIRYTIFDGALSNPTINSVEAAKEMYIESSAKAIIAVGGGSAIDLAKVCGARIVKPNKSVQKMKGLLHIRKKLPPLFAIPTTAGTGSEVTLAAVITDSQTNHKYPINDFSLIPHYAVLDYKMTLGLPKGLTSTTGMDALTHAIEAYIGRTRTAQTKKMSEEAVKLIINNLKVSYDNPTDVEARKNMLLAAHYAGIAFSKSYVGYIHAIAHSLGGKYHTPHGYANAIILPIFLDEYGSKIYKKLAKLSIVAGLATQEDTTKNAAIKLIDWIKEANAYMNIPSNIDLIKEEDIPQMAKHADKEANPLYPVPVLMDYKQLKEMYYKIKNN